MRKKFLLYLTDEAVTLYGASSEKVGTFDINTKDIFRKVEDLLSFSPKTPLSLLIDRSHQDIRAEKLPPLLPWDRLLFLLHKKKEWGVGGGYSGFYFLHHTKETYMVWTHISQNDPLIPWFVWMKTLPNPKGGIFFVTLEATNFLRQYSSPSLKYKLFVYPVYKNKIRHVVFKEDLLLLSRLFQEEEDVMRSLHFLSRSYPDINENLQVISLTKDLRLKLPHIKILSDPQSFLHFLSLKKRPLLSLKPTIQLGPFLLRRGVLCLLVCVLLMSVIKAYRGFCFKNNTLVLSSEVEGLRHRANILKDHLQHKDIPALRAALETYHAIKSHRQDPLKTFKEVSGLVKNHDIRLEKLEWAHKKENELVLTFLMKSTNGKALASQFNAFLTDCLTLFPKSKIQVLQAPFHSGPHEEFKMPLDPSPPLAQIKISFP